MNFKVTTERINTVTRDSNPSTLEVWVEEHPIEVLSAVQPTEEGAEPATEKVYVVETETYEATTPNAPCPIVGSILQKETWYFPPALKAAMLKRNSDGEEYVDLTVLNSVLLSKDLRALTQIK